VTIEARAVLTNSPPYGAFRGFGAPQTIFAIEMHMERAARALGIDPIELRRRNFLSAGDVLPTGQRLAEDPGLGTMLDEALAKLGPKPAGVPGGPWRGRGVSTFFHGSGFTGSGEVKLASRAALEIADDGRIRVLAASTDIGQGSIQVFTRIVADRLGLPFAAIEVVPPDTDLVPDSGPTVASRTTMVVGGLLDRAAGQMRQAVTTWCAGAADEPPTSIGFLAAATAYVKAGNPRRFECQYEPPPDVHWDDATYTGDAYAAYAWSVHAVDVAIDPLTMQAEVANFVAVQEVGRVLEPTLAAGQIQGGVAQGIGWALYEDVVLKDGVMTNHQLTNYILPTAADTAPIRTFFHEQPYEHGPQGAKGIGELPMDGPAPAIGAAIADATGVVMPRIPFLPERIMEAIDAAGGARR
jgi:CO/xanthine dehydrogenase Mo-binding subunit